MVEREDDDIWPDSAFWRYSLDLYAGDGVETACIALQERRDIDVNMVLFAFWLASCGKRLNRATLDAVDATVAAMRDEVVRPLRAIRRHLRDALRDPKPSSPTTCWPKAADRLRRRVLRAELDGEHLIQLALERAGADLRGDQPAGAVLAAANLRVIAPFDETDHADLATLFSRAIDGLTQTELSRALERVVSD